VAFCPGLRFVLDCVLSSTTFCSFEDHLLCFAKDKLYPTQNCIAFCLSLRFASEVLRFDLAFCCRRSCVLLKKNLVFCYTDIPSQQELDLLFGPLYDEFFNADHPLEQVHGNPLRPVQTGRQLATDPKMYMYALTVSTAEPKSIKEAMADSAWIEAMQEELHQFDRL
nr:putative ribonuclease H-like domain-containing protein [Tanacetum cinerariifolium]